MLDPLSVCIEFVSPPQGVRKEHPVRKLLVRSTEHPEDFTLELDYSSLSSFLACPRSAENSLVYSREPAVEGTATSFGRCFHLLEEYRLQHGYSPETVERQHAIIQQHFLENPVAPDEYRTAERMLQTITAYNEKYANPSSPFFDAWHTNVVQHEGGPLVERPFKIPFRTFSLNRELPYPAATIVAGEADSTGNSVRVRNLNIVLTGRIDVVINHANTICVVDHKTTSRGGREFFDYFHLSLQTRGYTWAAQKLLGQPVSGLILNAAVIRPITKTGVGTEFVRTFYPYSTDSLMEYETSMQHHVENFVHSLTSGCFPQIALSFKSPCSGCSYHENCRLPFHQRAADLASPLYKDKTWNPMND